MGAFRQAVLYRNPLVKHEAFTLPEAFFGGNGFQVLQDTALQVAFSQRIPPVQNITTGSSRIDCGNC